ncbi:cytochrome C' [Rubrivivax gelatinosus]|nr:cytochrome C' [Rubrivivax gelatinosus]
MRAVATPLCAIVLSAWLPAAADTELARQRICLGCHDIAQKRVGPPFQVIAARYAGQKDAAPRLALAIRQGSVNVWGPVPMPPNPKVTPDEARRLAAWVLTLR